MKYVPIEQTRTYTELSKYNQMSLKTLKIIFNQRLLDFEYYLKIAESRKFQYMGVDITAIDYLTENLQFYDECILKYYNEQLAKGMEIPEIFNTWKELNLNSTYFIWKN